jgi:hypothetical protein
VRPPSSESGFTASVTVFGATLGAQSGMSENETIHYEFFQPVGQNRFICGNDDFPSFASHIYVGLST